MRIYIAGPMRGKPYWNFPLFFGWAEMLRQWGHEPVNPAEIDTKLGLVPPANGNGFGVDIEECMARDLPEVEKSEMILLLPGWENSEGSLRELERATEKRLLIRLAESVHPVMAVLYRGVYGGWGKDFTQLTPPIKRTGEKTNDD